MYIFISHSSTDAAYANEVCSMLEENGYSCFLAPRDIRTGREYAEEIMNGIDRSDVCLLLMSEKSNHSPHVLREVERAVSKSIPILVYQLETVKLTKSMEYFLMAHQWMETNHRGSSDIILNQIREFQAFTKNEAEDIVAVSNSQDGNRLDLKKSQEKESDSTKKVSAYNRKHIIAGIVVAGILGIGGIVTMIHFHHNKDVFVENTEYLNVAMELGDTFFFGSCYGEPIQWRVIHFSEDKQCAYLITDHVISIKGFDGAESGNTRSTLEDEEGNTIQIFQAELEDQIQYAGDSSWGVSNLRTWLNSDRENVTYLDTPPTWNSLYDSGGYAEEPGFLSCFTVHEKEAIVENEIHTDGNDYWKEDAVTYDKVFLLSKEEVQWLKEANVNIYATPTSGAIGFNQSIQESAYGPSIDKTMRYWLRNPVEGYACYPYLVSDGENGDVYRDNIYAVVNEVGIRPVICVQIDQFKKCVSGYYDTEKEEAYLGGHYTFGSYNNESIEWRAVHFTEDGKLILLSENSITVKAFDAAEDGSYHNEYVEDISSCSAEVLVGFYGNSNWEDSNLRTWLNSKETNVTYLDQPPMREAMVNDRNGYNIEPGFLTNFSEDELAFLTTYSVETETGKGMSVTEDMVFLLSEEELKWLLEANVNQYATLTNGAMAQDETRIYEQEFRDCYKLSYHYYWLREPFEKNVTKNKIFSNGFEEQLIKGIEASSEWIGVRPAIVVDIVQFNNYLNSVY